MSSLQLLQYNNQQVRTVIKDGEPWFVASDLCRVIEHTNPSKAVAGLDDDEKGLTNCSTLGGTQALMCVSEPGMYKLMARSNKPSAKPFQRWLSHDVLPAIRKTGSYNAAPAPLALTREQRMAQAMLDAQEIMAEQSVLIQELAPKAEFFDSFVAADNWWDVRDVAQMLRNEEGIDTGEHRLFRWMRENKWLDQKNRPLQARLTQGLLELKLSDYVVGYRDGKPRYADPQVMVTPKGLDRLRRELTAPQKQRVITVAATANNKKRRSLNPA